LPTYAGIHPEFQINNYPPELHKVIRKISAHFYVTRSFRSIEIDNSSYYAILARPSDEFSIYVNTDREVVILFSTYSTFEIRTLNAFERVYELVESIRIDRSIRFLLSNDSKIEPKIRHYLEQHPEYPIIIPERLISVEITTSNPLLDAVRRNYLLRDLFAYQNPLREETFFFGRGKVVSMVLDRAKSGQNSSIFGLRKSGKTSAIYAIQRRARGMMCNVAVIDCQDPAVHARNYSGLLAYLIIVCWRTLGQKKQLPNLGDNPADVATNFAQHMSSILSASKMTMLLIFDEIENISPKTAASEHWRSGHDPVLFWQTIRSYIQSSGGGNISACLVGTSPHLLELSKINDVDNPVYLYAQKNFMPNLSFDETRDMVEKLGYFMGLEFRVEDIALLQKEFGGHPFFTRQVCSKIHQIAPSERPYRVSSKLIKQAIQDFDGQLESYLANIISHLRKEYPAEFDLLVAVIKGNKKELSEFGREAPELIDHLIGYGLVERVEEQTDIKFEAIRRALVKIVGDTSLETRWHNLVDRRNKIERDIRQNLFFWQKSISGDLLDSILRESLTEKRLQGLSDLNPNLIFSVGSSPLYLTDLLMIIKNEKVLSHIGARKSQITDCLNTLNRIRRDAHARDVTIEEMQSFNHAADILEAEFSPAA
jgi:hypothetical protein